MIDCPIYLNSASSTVTTSAPPQDDATCGCNCGYIQYESLIPYLAEIPDSLNLTPNKSTEFEFKFREQIAEISRLFDLSAGVTPGYFSKAHYRTTQTYTADGSKYIRVKPHLSGSLEVRTMDNEEVDPSTYSLRDEHLVFMPCEQHTNCGCTDVCGSWNSPLTRVWPDKCYQVTAKWGNECADLAVQMAVRDYLIERYRMVDPVIQLANGISIQRKFTVPHSWETYIKNFKAKREIFSNYAIA
jgi:hypothetical protein